MESVAWRGLERVTWSGWGGVRRLTEGLVFVGVGASGEVGCGVFEPEQVGGGWDGLDAGDIFEGAVDGGGLAADVAEGGLDAADLFFDFVHEPAELLELSFCAGEDAPDFVAFFLDGEGVEAHLEAGEDGHEGGGAGDGDAAVLLDIGLEAGAADDLGVEAFGGQEHDCVGHGGGGIDVFVADELGLGSDGAFKGFAGSCDFVLGSVFGDVLEALPVFAGEFGVYGEEDAGSFAIGELEGVLDDFGGSGFDAGVFEVLLWREHLFELLAEKELAYAAAGLDVGEDFFEVADSGGELLHFSEAFLDFAEVCGDLAEGFCEASLEGGVELFVDGETHLFEFGGVGFVEFGEAVFDGGAELVLMIGIAGHQVVEFRVEGLAEGRVLLGGFGGEGGEAVGEHVEALLDRDAKLGGGGFVVFAEAAERGVEGLAEGGDGLGDLGAEGCGGGVVDLAGAVGFGGDVCAELGDFVAEVVVEGVEVFVEADELVWDLRSTRVGRAGCRGVTEEKGYEAEEIEGGESEQGCEHVRISFSPEDTARWGGREIDRGEMWRRGRKAASFGMGDGRHDQRSLGLR